MLNNIPTPASLHSQDVIIDFDMKHQPEKLIIFSPSKVEVQKDSYEEYSDFVSSTKFKQSDMIVAGVDIN